MRAASVALTAALLLSACGGSDVSRTDVVGAMTNDAVPVRWSTLATEAEALTSGVASWCADGDGSDAIDAATTVRDGWLEL